MKTIIEKNKFEIRYLIYIIIVIICIISIFVGVYIQFNNNENISVIFKKKEDSLLDEDLILKENFLNMFTNDIEYADNIVGSVNKLEENEDIIVIADDTYKKTDEYLIEMKIPCFNIDSSTAKKINKEIKALFYDKKESIITSNKKDIIYKVKYKAYEKNNLLSIVILSELKEGEKNQRIIVKTYNYNLQENKETTINEILSIKGLDKNKVNSIIEDEINKSQKQNIKLKEMGYNINVREFNSDIYNVDNTEEYFCDKNGYVYIIYPYGNKEVTSEIDIIVIK